MESTLSDMSSREPDVPTIGSDVAPADANGERVTVAGYVIERELGRGGMGVVYQARQIALNRTVALKMILAGGHAGQTDLDRFRTEAEAIARLQHPNIVQIYEVGEHDGLPYFSLEFCNGGSLDHKLNGTPLPPLESAALVETLARAMQVAHDKGIIHRDLSPGNVLFDAAGAPKITDFGLAKRLDGAARTISGTVVGTPSYMSPEQASGKSHQVGPASDIYALGAILYECLTGRPPFKATSALDTLLLVIAEEAVGPRILNAQVPRDVETICLKCLRKDAGRRYGTATALAEDLRRFQRGEAIEARPTGVGERFVKWVKRNPLVAGLTVAMIAVVLLALTGLTGLTWYALGQAQSARLSQQETEEKSKLVETAKTHVEMEFKRADQERFRAEQQRDQAELFLYVSKLAHAQLELKENKGGIAQSQLAGCQWNLRGWEHHHLWTRCEEQQRTCVGHTGPVLSVAIQRDGKRIVSGSQDQTAKVWDADKGTELLTLKGHTEAVRSVAFNSDGKRIATASRDKTVKVWDAEKGQELLTLKGHTSDVLSVTFSPGGKYVASGSYDGTVKVWDAMTGQEKFTLKEGVLRGSAYSITYSPDGNHILSTTEGGALLWDATTGEFLRSFVGHRDEVYCVAYSPDGKRIVTGGEDPRLIMHHGPEHTGVVFRGHGDAVRSVAFTPDGQRVVSASRDATVKVWDADKGTELLSFNTHGDAVLSLAFHADGQRMVSGSADKTVKIWNANKRQEVLYLPNQEAFQAVYSPDGKRIVTADRTTATVWDAVKGQKVFTLRSQSNDVRSVAFSPDGKRILGGGASLSIWNTETGELLFTVSGHRGAFSRDGKRIVSADGKGTVKVCDAETGQCLRSFQAQNEVRSVAWSPNGKRILSGSQDKTAKVWDAETGQLILSLEGHTNWVTSGGWSADGKRILTGSCDPFDSGQPGEWKVWDAATGKELFTREHTGGVCGVVYSHDGKRFVSGDGEGRVTVWDANRGTELLSLDKKWRGIHCSVGFSPDGTRILIASELDATKVWLLDGMHDRIQPK